MDTIETLPLWIARAEVRPHAETGYRWRTCKIFARTRAEADYKARDHFLATHEIRGALLLRVSHGGALSRN
tara:strand:+ start:1365 stop:1577 length:213 start_codon:yes stop_codon:yes gene_type:complete